MKRKVLITGSNGMLGKDIVDEMFNKNEFDIYGISRSQQINSKIKEYICDLIDFKKVKEILDEIDPDIIIHCAANVNVDSCEKNKKAAYQINSEATRVLAAYEPSKVKFIYISTDSIFNGDKGNYSENDRPDPLNYYGFTKLEGERLVLQENLNSIIIRTNIYGFHKPTLEKSLVEWALKEFEESSAISGFYDVFFNPVYTKQLAKEIYNLIHLDFRGTINIGCKERISKYEFLVKLAEVFNIEKMLVNKSSIENTSFEAKRPKNTTLNMRKLNNTINRELKIEAGLKELFNDYNETDFIWGVI